MLKRTFICFLLLALSLGVQMSFGQEKAVPGPDPYSKEAAAQFINTRDEWAAALDNCESTICRIRVGQTSASLTLRTPAAIKELKTALSGAKIITHAELKEFDKWFVPHIRMEIEMRPDSKTPEKQKVLKAVLYQKGIADVFTKLVKSSIEASSE